jgi:type I restriction enzyme S subunit
MSAEFRPGYKQTEVGVIPDEWSVRRLGDLANLVASGRSKANGEYGIYPVYGSTGVIGYKTSPDYFYCIATISVRSSTAA